MLFNLALIVLTAMFLNWIFERLRLPGILGMMLAGIVLGPYCFNYISPDWLQHSGDIRTAALIIIMLRAGLGLERKTVNSAGLTLLKLGTIPAIFETLVIAISAQYLLDWSWFESITLGIVIAAVSPAIVVPRMLELNKRVSGSSVPVILLAGATIDNIFVLTMFGIVMSFIAGNYSTLSGIIFGLPSGIVLGLCLGFLAGVIISKIFKVFSIRDTRKVIIFIIIAIMLNQLGTLSGVLPVSGLIGIMTMAFVLLEYCNSAAQQIAEKIGKIWIFAEIILFVLVGAAINLNVLWQAGLIGILLIGFGLGGRSLGVMLALYGSKFTPQEKIFSAMTFLPKATVQAAIGALPLALGMKSGEIILAIAVMSIILTSPTGALLIKRYGEKMLKKN
jgi:NhaP-type Na+/H+ or K+/H+ antiporter